MKIIICIAIFISLSACTSKDILLKQGDQFSLYNEGREKQLVTFTIPEGVWGISKITLNTMKRGWFDINGQPNSNSPFGYAVRFSITPAERYGEKIIDVLKTQDFSAYAKKINTWSTPESLAEKKAENYGQGLILLNGFSCRNSWYEQKLAPHINNGNGIPVFINFITCPLVIDGRVFSFGVSTNSGVRPAYLQWLTEYNKDKKPEDQLTVDTYHHLSHLGDKVLEIFNTIQFHGKVSQNYDDILNPELY